MGLASPKMSSKAPPNDLVDTTTVHCLVGVWGRDG